MLSLSLGRTALAVLLVATPLLGQASCAVVRTDDFVARFDSDSIEFVPITDAAPPRHSWRFRLIAVERRSRGAAGPLPEPTQSTSEKRVSYARPGFVERYDLRRNGIEQSFAFDALPPGTGDLVVRGRVTTELMADSPGIAAQQLHFGAPDGSGVRIGAVTGIDGRGRTTAGLMRYADGELELVLPAAFVDEAALPLVLDPLIGTIYSPSVTGAGDTDPDVAYDETNDVFLVVFVRDGPGFPLEVGGVLMRPNGSAVGPAFEISDGQNPKVGNVDARDAFVVAYLRDTGLYTRTVHAATGAISAETQLVASNVESLLDVGDNSSSEGDQTPVLYHTAGFIAPGSMVGRRVRVPASGPPQVGASFFGRFGNDNYYPNAQMTECDALPGHYLVTYDEWAWCYGTPRNVWLELVAPNGRTIQTLMGSPFFGGGNTPDIAGDGSEYVLVYQDQRTSVVCQRVSVASGSMTLGPPVPVSANSTSPSVARLNGSFLVGFQRQGQSFVSSLDPSECTGCEGEFQLSVGSGSGHEPVVASRTRGGQPGDQAMLTWARSGSRNWIETSAFLAEDGIVTDLGGGCGQGGEARVSCARAGNANFTHELQSAAPGTQVLLVLGVGRAGFPCGTCTLVPDLALPVAAFSRFTTPDGAAALTTSLPAVPGLVGAKLVEQWLILTAGSCPLFGIDLSNAIEVEIQ